MSLILALLIIAAVALNYSKLMFMTFDRESARVSGIRVGRLDALLTVLTAITIVLGMKVVGILLVAALVVIPAAAGLQAASSFRMAVIVSSAVSTISVLLGLVLALSLNIPASASIVIICFIIFGIVFLLKSKRGLLSG